MMISAIRPLTAADEPFLWTMLYHALYVPAGQPPLPRVIVGEPDIRRYVQGWGRPGDAGVVAQAAGQAVGAAWLRLWTDDDRGYGFVDSATPELSMAVLPSFRGRRIGSQLLTHLLTAAQGSFSGVSLSVQRGNPALALYQRFGFRIEREDGDSLTMTLRWG